MNEQTRAVQNPADAVPAFTGAVPTDAATNSAAFPAAAPDFPDAAPDYPASAAPDSNAYAYPANSAANSNASAANSTANGAAFPESAPDFPGAAPDSNAYAYPLPESVTAYAGDGAAPDYKALYENLKREHDILVHNAEVARRAPVQGVTGGGAVQEPLDDFLLGFDSDTWQ